MARSSVLDILNFEEEWVWERAFPEALEQAVEDTGMQNDLVPSFDVLLRGIVGTAVGGHLEPCLVHLHEWDSSQPEKRKQPEARGMQANRGGNG
jgi:hypothetical protein